MAKEYNREKIVALVEGLRAMVKMTGDMLAEECGTNFEMKLEISPEDSTVMRKIFGPPGKRDGDKEVETIEEAEEAANGEGKLGLWDAPVKDGDA